MFAIENPRDPEDMDRWTPIAYYIHEEADGIASARSARTLALGSPRPL